MEPQPGFYYHYKHDSTKGVFDYAYEVLNIGHHTEIEDWKAGEMVVYRPLYESAQVYQSGKHWDVRPRAMFLESVIKNDKTFPRFQKITDSKIISKLENQVKKLYKN
ncbi:MAG TPA: DUF1653 domain-containing protein [Candidatus Paceibacterota bacterium]|nr:DUF1653 domain-containing protein [Candidatus Paceibacterota bacterium]